MKKFLKKEVVISFIIGVILTSSIAVYATNTYLASQIIYKDGKSVEEALNYLYNARLTYLYDCGDEKESITGGWNIVTKSYNEYYTVETKNWFDGNGSYSGATVSKNQKNLTVETSHPGGSGYGNTEVYIQNSKKIDLTHYKKIFLDGEYTSNYNAYFEISILDKDNEILKSASINIDNGTILDNNKEIDVSQINEEATIRITLGSSATGGTNGKLVLRRIIIE